MGTAPLTAPEAVGLKGTEPGAIHDALLAGLPYSALERFEKNTQLVGATVARVVGISPRTLVRRKQEKRLKPDESDRL